MKKQFLLSAFAVVLAVGGVFASSHIDDAFYPAGDSSCSEAQLTNPPCDPAVGVACEDENQIQYYYKINGTGDCLPLTRAL